MHICKSERPKTKDLSLRAEKGFTLIELSIVIVIIGLLVAGVVGGQSLVQQSKLRSQIAQLQQYQVAYNAFKLEFNKIPGDFNRASSYWSGVSDGDGNGIITNTLDNLTCCGQELPLFFQHLSRAGLVKEEYDGSSVVIRGYPELKIADNKGLAVGSQMVVSGTGTAIRQLSNARGLKRYKTILGLHLSSAMPHGARGVESPKVIGMIDSKIDDGKAAEGIFHAFSGYQGTYNCLTGIDGEYNLSNNDKPCHGVYIVE